MKKENNYNIFIKDLVLKALIGIYPHEKVNKQKIRFNISISAKDKIKNDGNDIRIHGIPSKHLTVILR